MQTARLFWKVLTVFLVVSVIISFTRISADSQTDAAEDRTLSPYFLVKSEDSSLELMPLKASSADVHIVGVIADVRVEQVYKNTGKNPIEAVYIFPASTRAALYGMKMAIGKRVIEAKISKRDDARREYEQAREQGRSASLLEQQRPNVFQMNVANIMPGDEIRVELKYTELLVPTDGIYEFVYPTVVGPRYSNKTSETAPASEQWLANPYLHEGEAPNYSFDIKTRIDAGLPIKDIASPSHKVKTDFVGPTSVAISLDGSDAAASRKDYILHYRLAGDQVQSGLLLFEGEKEKFFLLMIQPPKRVQQAEIPPREYIFIVDVSGSMWGYPLEISKKLFRDLAMSLRPTDKFNVLLFSGGSSVFSEKSLPASRENISRAVNLINGQRGAGGTELLPALQRALSLQRPEGYSRTIVIATDGYVPVETEVFDLIRNKLGEANMFAFGIGTSVNRHIIEGMAHVGLGESFVITKVEEAQRQADRFRSIIQSPVLTNIKIDYDGFNAFDIEPPAVPDVLAERPVVIFGKWKGEAAGKIRVTGITGSGPFSQIIDVSTFKPSGKNAALGYLWARHRIAVLNDYNNLVMEDKRVTQVTDLGLKYNLLTSYTSFVAVDSEVHNTSGQSTTIKQPLPLPVGVSDYAIGSTSSVGQNFLSMAAPCAPSEMHLKAKAGGHAYKYEIAGNQDDGAVGIKKAVVWVDSVKVKGRISKVDILQAISSQMTGLGKCGYTGRITISFTIAPDGKVKNVRTTGSTTVDHAETCILETIGKWVFSVASGETTVRASLVIQ